MKIKLIISTLLIGFISLSFSIKDDDQIKMVISKMNDFYLTQSLSMASSIEYSRHDGTKEEQVVSEIKLFKHNYFYKSNDELHLKNSSIYLNINTKNKVIHIYKMLPSDPDALKSEITKQWQGDLDQFIDRKITSDDKYYKITFFELGKNTSLFVSKKDFSLVKFSCDFIGDKTYKNVTVKYKNTKVEENINSTFFDEKKYIKFSKKKYQGMNQYRNYKIIDNTTK